MLCLTVVSAIIFATATEKTDSQAGIFSSLKSTVNGYVPWGSGDNFLEEARKMNNAGESPSRKVNRFTLPASRFSAKEKQSNDEEPPSSWVGSMYAYFTEPSKEDTPQEVLEENDGYLSSAYKYVASHVLSEPSDADSEKKESSKSRFREKIKSWHVVLIVGIALVILGAAIALIYGLGKRKQSENDPAIYKRV